MIIILAVLVGLVGLYCFGCLLTLAQPSPEQLHRDAERKLAAAITDRLR